MPLHVSSTCAHHQEVKIALQSHWYFHTYRCDDTRGCVMTFWPPDDEHMFSKHVETWNKLIVKQKFCASSWLITEMHDQQNVKKWLILFTHLLYRMRQKEHPDLGGAYFRVGSAYSGGERVQWWGARTVVGSASSNSGVRTVFNIHHGVVGRTSSLYC